MNLLTQKVETNESDYFTISNFRSTQYSLIDYFMNLSVEYIAKQNKNYLNVKKVTIRDIPTYNGIHHNALTQVTVDITVLNQADSTKPFINFFIPTLIDDCFFILNGNYFIPTLYILDRPIVIKKNSVKLSSTFNSITIYDKLVTFMGNNMPIMHFLNIFLDDADPGQADIKQEYIQTFNIPHAQVYKQDLLSYFANLFKCDADRAVIQRHFNDMFFDDYSKLLYSKCYDIEEKDLSIQTVLKRAIELNRNSDEYSFIDLNQKRLVFIEILLWPIFKRIAQVASRATRGFFINEIQMDSMELVKNFYINLHNRFIYDNVNAYNTMIQHKAYMLSPNAERAPGIVANLHQSHYKRICPTSVSSQNPGETIYVIAETEVDAFGRFI